MSDPRDFSTATAQRWNPEQATEAVLHLVVVWSAEEGHRVGECAALGAGATLGRSAISHAGDPPRLEFFRSRPGQHVPTGSLTGSGLSRRQWVITPSATVLRIVNVGKNALLHNSVAVGSCEARSGDVVSVAGVVSFVVEARLRFPAGSTHSEHRFGERDRWGIVGESAAAWQLRRELAQVAEGPSHVLIQGPSGTGKELSATAIHGLSVRARGPLVSRNAATIPEGLLAAELFGHARDYPNSGMPARPGLFGQADGGTLFLDEIGELGEAQQAALLRVLDAGEYQRLGEDKVRRCDVRVIGATNRPDSYVKGDLLARFTERVCLGPLNERRSDIPLIAKELLRARRRSDRIEAASQEFMEFLVRRDYETNVRELERLLRAAPSVSGVLTLSAATRVEVETPRGAENIDENRVREAVFTSASIAEAAKKLGLPSRFALYRMLKRLGIDPQSIRDSSQ